MEEWKDIQGYEGKYKILNTGKVISLPRKRWNGKSMANLNGKEKSFFVGKIGYKCTRLWKDNKSQLVYLHRLLAIYFIPNPNNLEQVNHINGIKTDNSLSNLEWVTQAQNMTLAGTKGLMAHGEKQWQTKLNNKAVMEIREKYAKGGIYERQLAEEYGVSRSCIGGIITRKHWKHI